MLTGHFISAPTYLEDLNTVDAVIFNLLLLKVNIIIINEILKTC